MSCHVLLFLYFGFNSKDYLLCEVNSINKLDVRGSVHRSTILTEKPNKMQQCIKILL